MAEPKPLNLLKGVKVKMNFKATGEPLARKPETRKVCCRCGRVFPCPTCGGTGKVYSCDYCELLAECAGDQGPDFDGGFDCSGDMDCPDCEDGWGRAEITEDASEYEPEASAILGADPAILCPRCKASEPKGGDDAR